MCPIGGVAWVEGRRSTDPDEAALAGLVFLGGGTLPGGARVPFQTSSATRTASSNPR